MKNIPDFVDFVNEANLITADDQSYLDQIISYVRIKKIDNDKDFTREVLYQLKSRVAQNNGLVKKRFEKILKTVKGNYDEGKFISVNESVVNEKN